LKLETLKLWLSAGAFVALMTHLAKNRFNKAAPRFPSEDKERLLSEILRACQN
jgi:hypothetical protein